MRNPSKTVLAAAALVGLITAAPALYAQESGNDDRSRGMMMGGHSQGMMMGGQMMRGNGAMMPMMSDMKQMMASCNAVMRSMMASASDGRAHSGAEHDSSSKSGATE